ncbi:hydrolase [Mesorhizobium sp. L-8-10]|uniref:MBL fold metallo-hydrolase n=1 Tax=Mesorhizobium sp. L-8-10 TaxID=2744523 RepID=UPI00192912AC|nr:MBL fold metallo-hydrolase [Mesorhizobium sp. L-8-10]BCH34419.1 hydrolase [Mesorhizobium sp. L-8-10]
MADRLVLLGTKGGPALRPGGPWPTSSLLEIGGRSIVVDCGLGVTRALTEAGVGLKTLDLVFITHLHSDHVLELGPLLHTAWTAGLARTVRVYGPAGTGHYWQRFLQSMEFDIEIRIGDEGRPDLRDLVVVEEFTEGPVMEAGGLAVSALRVDHPPVTECFALRFESGGKSVVFSADTTLFPPLAGFARGASILVHEAMLEEGIDRLVARTGNGARLKEHLLASHTLAADAGRIAADAGVGHLVLHHLIPADDPGIGESDWIDAVRTSWNGPLTIGRDGLALDLPAKGAGG